MKDRSKRRLAGATGGVINGVFGGGGGTVLLPLLVKWCALEQRKAFATCVAIVVPMCCVSAAVYLWQVRPPLQQVMPYLIGGAAGGVLGGLAFEKVPVRILRLLFGGFLLYGGWRYLM